MSYDTSSFSSEFWFAEGEPYDRSTLALNAKGQPISFWSAATMALDDRKFRREAARELKVAQKYLTPEMLLDRAQEIATCGTLSTPVDVHLDEGGWLTVDVYDGPEAEQPPEPAVRYLDESDIVAKRQTEAPPNRSRTGYGGKIPTSWELKLSDNRWHRVYVMQYSNAGTAYVVFNGERTLLGSYNPIEGT